MNATATKQTFGERLRRARLMRGLTLREVAARLAETGTQLSHAAYQKYEKGLMGPDSTVLLAMARLFDVDVGYFFRQKSVSLGTIEFRKLAKFPEREVNRVREEAADFFEKYLQIEEILELAPAPLPRKDLTGFAPDQGDELARAAEEAAEMIRREWKLGEAALSNVHELLEEHGVKVKEVTADESFNGFSGWADGCTPVIVLASWLKQDLPRKRLTALHELGHLVLSLPAGLAHKQKESLCFRFAGAMLLPAAALRMRVGVKRPDGISMPERLGIKADWGISISALMRRAADLGILTQNQLELFHISNRLHRKIEPGRWEGSETADRFEQLVFRAVSQELITRAKAAEFLDLTLRELDHHFAAEAA